MAGQQCGVAALDRYRHHRDRWPTNRPQVVELSAVDPPPGSLFSTLVYYKGGFILYMLRTVLGRDVFNAGMSDYLERHAYGNATTQDLQRVMEEHHGEDLDWFFDQWLYQATGTPHLRLATRVTALDGSWELEVTVQQIHLTGRMV